MKKILLLYAFDHSGHHQASLALAKAFSAVSTRIAPEVFSVSRLVTPGWADGLERAYLRLLKAAPFIWDGLYDNAFVFRCVDAAKPAWAAPHAARLQALLEREIRPDAVICTQALPCLLTAEYKRRTGAKLPLFAVLTDFYPHAYWIDDQVTQYIVPGDAAAHALERRGVAPDRIRVFGIPVDPDYAAEKSSMRRDIRKRLGLDPDHPLLLVTGGSQGMLPWKPLLKELDRLGVDFQTAALIGKNEPLRREIEKSSRNFSKPLKVFSYVDNASDWFLAADAVIMKAGGLSVAESAALGRPTVVMDLLPGQERRNVRALAGHAGIAVVRTPLEAARRAGDFLSNPSLWNGRAPAANGLRFSRSSALDIARHLEAFV